MDDLELSEVVEKVTAFIGKKEAHFIELNENSLNQLDFAKECEFAKQLLLKNNYTLDAARNDPDALHAAIGNVAAIGITLNPALAYAYLVPRKKSICLDISYRGMIKLATDTGTIKAIKAELIYENDVFHYHGFHEAPEFKADVFGDRGELKGVYAMALLVDGGVLVETMPIDEVYAIRDDSEAYKSAKSNGENSWQYKANVWVKYKTEMVKKTVIKRAFKTLPPSRGTELLGRAIDVVNEHEGIDFNKPPELPVISYTDQDLAEYHRCIKESDFFNLVPLIRSLDVEAQQTLQRLCLPEAPHGQKGKLREEFSNNIKNAEKKLDSTLNLLREALDDNEDINAQELLDDCSVFTKDWLINQLSTEHQMIINEINQAA